jgi:hypothetical protein
VSSLGLGMFVALHVIKPYVTTHSLHVCVLSTQIIDLEPLITRYQIRKVSVFVYSFHKSLCRMINQSRVS